MRHRETRGLVIGAGRRLHYKTDLFWVQYLDILSLLPGGLGIGDWGLVIAKKLLIADYLLLITSSSLILHPSSFILLLGNRECTNNFVMVLKRLLGAWLVIRNW